MNLDITLGLDYDLAVATSGNDAVTFSTLSTEVQLTLQTSTAIDAVLLLGGDDSASDDNAARLYTGNAGNDQLFGNGGADTLLGGQGRDRVEGGDGDDVLSGNLGDDVIDGGSGNDVLLGGQDGDMLLGGVGDDSLRGDRGADTLTGGAGRDSFFTDNTGDGTVDVITDFQLGVDRIVTPDGLDPASISVTDADASVIVSIAGQPVAVVLNTTAADLIATNLGQETTTMTVTILALSDGRVGSVAQDGSFSGTDVGRTFLDIARDDSGTLWGITSSSLYRVDSQANRAEFVGLLGAGNNLDALDFDNNNNLIATDDDGAIYRLNLQTGAAEGIAQIADSRFDSSGDIVFDAASNRFFATSEGSGSGSSDILYSFDLNGAFTRVGEIGFSQVFGLAMRGSELYGYTRSGSELAVNKATGTGTFLQSINLGSSLIYGSAS
jgi:RTX calcium-binding nonapeptide repeat (4 copies)